MSFPEMVHSSQETGPQQTTVIQQGSARLALGFFNNKITSQEKEGTSREQKKEEEARQGKGKTKKKKKKDNNAQQEENKQAGKRISKQKKEIDMPSCLTSLWFECGWSSKDLKTHLQP